MSSVSIHALNIRLGAAPILESLDLQVREGEFLVLLGPSGCGKSTLLHSIAGLLDVDEGRIEIGGNDVTWADPKDRGIGMVFQSYALYPTLNVERNLSFGLRIAGVERHEIQRRVQRAASMLQLDSLLDRKPSQLSGGQRQRVAIGRALVRQAQVFLFDEPLSNLDAKLRAELRRELKQLHCELGSTMIYVTHDQVEAMTLASRIAVMRAGRIQQIGTPSQVYDTPANLFVAGFLGSPSMNFIDGELGPRTDDQVSFIAHRLQVPLGLYPFLQCPQPGRKVVLGVRPEHLTLQPPGEASGHGTVTLVEPMGSHAIVWLDDHGRRLAVQAPAGQEPAPGAKVAFHLDPARVSLFDHATQQRL
ncbi:ABC transporter ATP-binding protein [Caldimonas brevitalea]|uniref:ABC transporter ATP-binding protein n=1 Tax=Caldimonas brevitalea TaxID=413882 RepID=A0A0G3BJS5_9BURK|nr:ABC transporter ATP-binding protein [Caldimonas brevitalea]AKJ29642.1 ABC transporter ATP-binding protein [Caldimonas brevitalea]